MEIINRKLSEIKPHPNNPKIHPQSQIDMIVKSVKEFGFTSPILVDMEDFIISGHARRQAALSMGMDELPTIQVDLPAEKAMALRIADNRLGELGGFDIELLQLNFEEILKIEGLDVEAIGYDLDEINAFLNINKDFSFEIGDDTNHPDPGAEGYTEDTDPEDTMQKPCK